METRVRIDSKNVDPGTSWSRSSPFLQDAPLDFEGFEAPFLASSLSEWRA